MVEHQNLKTSRTDSQPTEAAETGKRKIVLVLNVVVNKLSIAHILFKDAPRIFVPLIFGILPANITTSKLVVKTVCGSHREIS